VGEIRDYATLTADTAQAGQGVSVAGLTLTGWAARYNEPAQVETDWQGAFTEILKPGVFRDSLAAGWPALLWDHGRSALLGTLPLGRITTIDDCAEGLWIEAQLSDSWATEPIRSAIRDGSVRGMSFNMQVPKGGDRWERSSAVYGGQLRTVTRAKLLETSPVVFPAYEGTSVGLRSSSQPPRRGPDQDRRVSAWESDVERLAKQKRQRRDNDAMAMLRAGLQ
jgi:uncharacterized protein